MAKKSAQSTADSLETSSQSTAEKSPPSAKIHIDGKDYDAGDTLTIDGETATAVATKHLTASQASGVSAGTYSIVSTLLQPGNRRVFRAIVGGKLYPIREYGEEGETISKIRAPRRANRTSRESSSSNGHESNGAEGHFLSPSAERTLSEYLEIETGKRGDDILSALVDKHIKPEVEKAKTAVVTVRRLPADILALLGGADEAAYEKIRKALGHH